MSGLYIHIPFCAQKCAYCDFYSLPVTEFPSLGKTVERFFQALEKELTALPHDFQPDTIYFGGGTPTVFTAERLGELLELVRRRVRTSAVREWTVEANPGTLDTDKARAMQAGGVTRISLGVQTLNDKMLARLGRIHTAEDARRSFILLHNCGFEHVSVDLMYALPGEMTAQVLADVRGLLAWDPEHISCYALSIEPGTPLAKQLDWGEISEVPDEEQAEQYQALRREVLEADFQQYEISNFALPGRECLHNLNYWRGGEYAGCGPAAHGHSAGRRHSNVEDLDAYCRRIEQGGTARDFEEKLEPEAKARETLIVWLRLLDGVDLAAFRQLTGFDALALGGAAVEKFIAEDLLALADGRLRLTERALFVSNRIFAELV